MKNFKSKSLLAIIITTILFSCGPVDPSEKSFYKLSDSKPYRFDKNGSVETWDQGKQYYDKSCRSTGSWRVEGDVVIVSGVQNPNCPWMSERNGRFKLNGDLLERQ